MENSVSHRKVERGCRHGTMTDGIPQVPSALVREQHPEVARHVVPERALHALITEQIVKRPKDDATEPVWLESHPSRELNDVPHRVLDLGDQEMGRREGVAM